MIARNAASFNEVAALYDEIRPGYSDHRALPEPERTSFFQAIADTIERTGGTVRRRYETVLIGARKH